MRFSRSGHQQSEMSHYLYSRSCIFKASAIGVIVQCHSVLEVHVDNAPITQSVPLRDSILQARVSDKEPLSRGHFGHQKSDDVISDRSAVSPFLCR